MRAPVFPAAATLAAPGGTPARRADLRAATIALVALAHAGALALLLTMRTPPAPPVASPVLSAELLAPDTAARPAALHSSAPAQPRIAHPVTPKARPRPVPPAQPTAAATTKAKAMPPAATPTPEAAPDLTPAPAATPHKPTAAVPPALASALAASATEPAPVSTQTPTLAIAAPKDVSHLDCAIARPDYPLISRRRGETGTVDVSFVVGLTGALEQIAVRKSSGYARLDAAALAAVKASTCKPYRENGVPVRAAYTQPYQFGLDG